MLRKTVFALALASCVTPFVRADTVQLKDKAAVTGKILAEKRDQVVIDVGYTVLVVPRNQVTKISKNDSNAPAEAAAPARAVEEEKSPPENLPGFYVAPNKPGPASNV